MFFYKPAIRRSDMQSVLMSLADEAIGTGKRYEQFKNDFKNFLGFKNIELLRSLPFTYINALSSLELKSGDKIMVSAFASSLFCQVAKERGYNLVVVDVDKKTGLIDTSSACQILSSESNIKAVALFSLIPIPEDVSIFQSRGIKVLYDITGFVGMDIPLCDIAVVSLESDEIISSAGGAVLFSNDVTFPKIYVEDKLSDMNVSFAHAHLSNYNLYLTQRQKIKERYLKAFEISAKDSSNKLLSPHDSTKKDNAAKFSIFLENTDENLSIFNRKKVPIKNTFSSTYIENFEDKSLFPIATYLYNKSFDVPLYYFLKEEEIDLIRKILTVLV